MLLNTFRFLHKRGTNTGYNKQLGKACNLEACKDHRKREESLGNTWEPGSLQGSQEKREEVWEPLGNREGLQHIIQKKNCKYLTIVFCYLQIFTNKLTKKLIENEGIQ